MMDRRRRLARSAFALAAVALVADASPSSDAAFAASAFDFPRPVHRRLLPVSHPSAAAATATETATASSRRSSCSDLSAASSNVSLRSRCRSSSSSRSNSRLCRAASVAPVDEKEGVNGSKTTKKGGRRWSFLNRWKNNDVASTANRKMLKENSFAILAGLCLSFNAGYVNGACMSGLLHSAGSKVSVAGFTGAYTTAGLAFARGDYATMYFFVKMIASFVGGSMLSGLLNPKPVPHRMGPTYGPTFLVGSIMLAVSSVLSLKSAPCNSMFYLAAAANGLQNGMSSMYTANLVRSCHMSGTSTDIGMILGQMLGGNRENAWKALVLIGLASSFTLGGVASYWAVTTFRSLALAFNAAAFFMIGVGSVAFTSIQQRVSLWQAASGQWKWKSDQPSEDTLMELFDKNAVEVFSPRALTDGDAGEDDVGLDEEGLRAVLKEAGMIVSDVGVTAIFKVADTNGDGAISRDEFFGLILCDVEGEECKLI